MDVQIIAVLITALVSLSVSSITWWSTRQRNSAEAYDKLSATVERQDARQEQLRVEIDALRDRVGGLEGEVETLTRYLRRVIEQLRRADIAPDLPPDVIERLSKGL